MPIGNIPVIGPALNWAGIGVMRPATTFAGIGLSQTAASTLAALGTMAAIGAMGRVLESTGYSPKPPGWPMFKRPGTGVRRPAVTIAGISLSRPAATTLAAAGTAATALAVIAYYRKKQRESGFRLFRSGATMPPRPAQEDLHAAAA